MTKVSILVLGFHGVMATGMAVAQDALELNKAGHEQLQAYDQFFQKNSEQYLDQVAELVAIPTHAMFPANAPDLKRAGSGTFQFPMQRRGISCRQ